MNTQAQIANLRARRIAKRDPRRAAELLIAIGMAGRQAIGVVLDARRGRAARPSAEV